MSNQNYNNSDLIKGLKPAIELPVIGNVFQDTTKRIAEKVAEELRSTAGISELDQVLITPKMARNSVGVSYVDVMAYFNLQGTNGNPNIFRRSGKKGNNGNGRQMMVNFSGGNNNGGGSNYGMSDAFRGVFSSLVPQNDNGKASFRFKQVSGVSGIVGLELDFNQVMMLALGIKSNDAYDFSVVNIYPINNNNDFCMILIKMIAGSQKGKTSGVNYARIQQDRFNQVNAGGGNRGGNQGGGRSY